MSEVDLGTTALIGATTFVMMFVAGTNSLLLGALSMMGVGGIMSAAITLPILGVGSSHGLRCSAAPAPSRPKRR